MKKQSLQTKSLRNGMYALVILATTLGNTAHAQQKVKDGTVVATPILPNSSAILDLESASRGLLLPRVALTSTTSFAPLLAHVAGMHVYNTATAGDVTPGAYYNDGTKWVKVGNAASITTDWQKVGTATAAVNTDDQYVMAAKVGIGTATPATRLDINNGTVNGAIKIVDGTQGAGKYLGSDANGVGTWTSFAQRVRNIVNGTGGSLASVTCGFFGIPGTSLTLPQGVWTVNIEGNVAGGTLGYTGTSGSYFDVVLALASGTATHLDGNIRKVFYAISNSGGTGYGVSYVVNVTSATATFGIQNSVCGLASGSATCTVLNFSAVD